MLIRPQRHVTGPYEADLAALFRSFAGSDRLHMVWLPAYHNLSSSLFTMMSLIHLAQCVNDGLNCELTFLSIVQYQIANLQ